MVVLGIIVWLIAAYINAGFILAFWSHLTWLDTGDLTLSIGLSLIPLTWIITFFVTGFYQSGWMKPAFKK